MCRKIRRAVAAVGLLAVGLGPTPADAQATWTVRALDADTVFSVAARPDSPRAALDALHGLGYVAARVDSTVADTLFVTAGPLLTVHSVDVVGTNELSVADITDGWTTRTDEPYRPRELAADLQRSAAAYARIGHVDAVLVPDVEVGEDGVAVRIRVDEGLGSVVAGVELLGVSRPSRAFASRVARMAAGTSAGDLDAAQIRQSLDATGLYLAVGEPVLARAGTGELVVQVPVQEAPPGAFDLVVGFLPPAGGDAGQVVGSGRLNLRNLFGGGRAVDVELERNPGLASSLVFAARDPFVLGSAIGAGVRFEGTARDSTFSRQRAGVDVSYPLGSGLALIGSVRRESIRPGTFGAGEIDGRPRVRRADALYAGAGVLFQRLDAQRNPRAGLTLGLFVEQGRPRRDAVDTGAPSLGVATVYRRLTADVRAYVPTWTRQTAVLGLDLRVLQGPAGPAAVYDEAELYRIGGAQSLRGYDEEAFLGRAIGRLLGEYRLLFDAESYGVAFVDFGFVDRPSLPGLEAQQRWLPGYGAGVRVRTGVGLGTITYALNPDLPLGRGKVHVGLEVGL